MRPTAPTCGVPLEITPIREIWCAALSSRSFPARPAIPTAVSSLCAYRGGGAFTRKEIDGYTAYVGDFGARGSAYVKCNEVARARGGLQSPILKFMPDETIAGLLGRTGAADGDMIFFGCRQARGRERIHGGVACASRGTTSGLSGTPGVRCGSWIFRCLNLTRRPSAGPRCITRSPRRSIPMTCTDGFTGVSRRALMIWWSMAPNSAAVRSASRQRSDATRCVQCDWVRRARERGKIRLLIARAQIRLPAARRHRVRS